MNKLQHIQKCFHDNIRWTLLHSMRLVILYILRDLELYFVANGITQRATLLTISSPSTYQFFKVLYWHQSDPLTKPLPNSSHWYKNTNTWLTPSAIVQQFKFNTRIQQQGRQSAITKDCTVLQLWR